MTTELLLSSAINEIGKRTNNEDSVFPNSEINSSLNNLFLVCDGVGGHAKGEIASDLVCSQLARYYEQERIEVSTPEQIERGIQFVENQFDSYMLSNPDSSGMGTTLTLLHLHRQGASLAHIGDSRIYHLRGGEILFRTKDHSLVQTLVDLGEITEEEAVHHPNRNQITNAIQGASVRRAKPSQHSITDLRAGDLFVLCTDGVLESVTDEDLRSFSREGYEVDTIALKMRRLCEVHSRDNFSAYIIKLTEEYIQSLELPQAGGMSVLCSGSSPLERTAISEPQEAHLSNHEGQARGFAPQGEANAESAPALDEAASSVEQAERLHTQIFADAESGSRPTPPPPPSPTSPPVPPVPPVMTDTLTPPTNQETCHIPRPSDFGVGIPPKGIARLSKRMLLYIVAACVGLLLALGAIFFFKSGGAKTKGRDFKQKENLETSQHRTLANALLKHYDTTRVSQ